MKSFKNLQISSKILNFRKKLQVEKRASFPEPNSPFASAPSPSQLGQILSTCSAGILPTCRYLWQQDALIFWQIGDAASVVNVPVKISLPFG